MSCEGTLRQARYRRRDVPEAASSASRPSQAAVPTKNLVLLKTLTLPAPANRGPTMRSVVVSLLLALRASLRDRAAQQLEILTLRNQLHVVNRPRPHRLRSRRPTECYGSGCRKSGTASSRRHRQARNGTVASGSSVPGKPTSSQCSDSARRIRRSCGEDVVRRTVSPVEAFVLD